MTQGLDHQLTKSFEVNSNPFLDPFGAFKTRLTLVLAASNRAKNGSELTLNDLFEIRD